MSAARRRVEGTAVVLPGDDLDTDRIIPARFAAAPTFREVGAGLFADDRAAASRGPHPHALDGPGAAAATVLVVDRNFGCGSSREHAVHALVQGGFAAVVGLSFGSIFQRNCPSVGLVAATLPDTDHRRLRSALAADPGRAVVVDVERALVECDGLRLPAAIDPASRHELVTGSWDVLASLLDALESVDEHVSMTAAYRYDPDLRS